MRAGRRPATAAGCSSTARCGMVGQAAGRVWMAARARPGGPARVADRHAVAAATSATRPRSAELIEPALEDAYLLLVGDAAALPSSRPRHEHRRAARSAPRCRDRPDRDPAGARPGRRARATPGTRCSCSASSLDLGAHRAGRGGCRREPDPSALYIAGFLRSASSASSWRTGFTTSTRRTEELVGALPSSRRQRTLALCLACLVPARRGGLRGRDPGAHRGSSRPPVPADAPMAWFGQEAVVTDVPRRLVVGPVACRRAGRCSGWCGHLGAVPGLGPRRRGRSCCVACSARSRPRTIPPLSWRALPPCVGSQRRAGRARKGRLLDARRRTSRRSGTCVYVVLLCALGVVVALLREREGRRPFLWAAGGLAVGAAGALALTIS